MGTGIGSTHLQGHPDFLGTHHHGTLHTENIGTTPSLSSALHTSVNSNEYSKDAVLPSSMTHHTAHTMPTTGLGGHTGGITTHSD